MEVNTPKIEMVAITNPIGIIILDNSIFLVQHYSYITFK